MVSKFICLFALSIAVFNAGALAEVAATFSIQATWLSGDCGVEPLQDIYLLRQDKCLIYNGGFSSFHCSAVEMNETVCAGGADCNCASPGVDTHLDGTCLRNGPSSLEYKCYTGTAGALMTQYKAQAIGKVFIAEMRFSQESECSGGLDTAAEIGILPAYCRPSVDNQNKYEFYTCNGTHALRSLCNDAACLNGCQLQFAYAADASCSTSDLGPISKLCFMLDPLPVAAPQSPQPPPPPQGAIADPPSSACKLASSLTIFSSLTLVAIALALLG